MSFQSPKLFHDVSIQRVLCYDSVHREYLCKMKIPIFTPFCSLLLFLVVTQTSGLASLSGAKVTGHITQHVLLLNSQTYM